MAFTNDKFRLDGKVAVVTGAGGRGNGLGRAFAFGLGNAGASVVVTDLNGAGAQALAEELQAAGIKSHSVQVDISDPEATARLAAETKKAFGGADILVNCAGMMTELSFKPLIEMDMAEWNKGIAVNVRGAVNCAAALAPLMRERGGGKIVNISSAGAFNVASFYGITKLAILGVTTTLAKELGGDNIQVNAIAPGMTKSDAAVSMTPDGHPFLDAIARQAVKPKGEPDDLVGPLLMLCSPASDWVTGQVLSVDGGFIMR